MNMDLSDEELKEITNCLEHNKTIDNEKYRISYYNANTALPVLMLVTDIPNAVKNTQSNLVFFCDISFCSSNTQRKNYYCPCQKIYDYICKASKQKKTKLIPYKTGWINCLKYAKENCKNISDIVLQEI